MFISRACRLATMMVLYLAESTIIKLTTNSNQRLTKYSKNASKYARAALKLMRLELEVSGSKTSMDSKNYLIVSNHMSYLDAMIMNSIKPSVFVTSEDMGEKFFIGTVAEMGGSIFIERRHRDRVEQDRSVIAQALRDGFNVVIYPEGTSSNGSHVLPFKKSLLMAAVDAGVDILPVALNYREVNGEPFQEKNRDKICWYGDMAFLSHLIGVLKLKSWKAEVKFLSPIIVTSASTRDDLATSAFEAVSGAYEGLQPAYVESHSAMA